MALKSQAATQDALNAMNVIGNGGTMRFYSGTPPSAADDTPGPQLASITLESPAFTPAQVDATEATADLVIGGGKTDDVDVAGTCTYYRILGTTSIISQQGTVGLIGSGEDLELDDNVFLVGGVVDITGLTVDLPVPPPP